MFGITELSFNSLTAQPFLTALFFILFVLFAIYLYRRTNPPLSKGIRILLTSLRIIAVIAIFLALFEPVVSYKREFERKPKLTLLVDQSRSMDIAESGISRSRRIDSLLASSRFTDFAARFEVKVVPFAGGILDDGSQIDRDKTALGDALAAEADKELAQPSESWLLLSDGISNDGISPTEAASRIKTRIYSIGVGVEASEKDVAIAGLDHNQVVFAGKPTAVMAHLEWQGMKNEKSRIEIRSGEKAVASDTIEFAQGTLKADKEIRFIPEKPGQQTFEITVAGLPDEISAENNSRSFSMTVLKSKVKVLLAADHLDWEYAFLNRFLSSSESVELTPVVYKMGGGYLFGDFPTRQEELNQYDLVILYDVNPEALKSRKDIFDSFLKDRGGSLLVLLGENYLRASFPRWLDSYLPFVSTRKDNKLLHLKYNGQPAENFLFHPAVRISDSRQSIREQWQNLPHFEALVPTDSLAPLSEVLVSADISAGKNMQPIIAYRNFGGGRVLAVAAMPFWHWAFFGYGFGDNDEEYRKFFDGVVNWLSVKEDSDPIRIVPDKLVYARGEKVGFAAFVYDLGFRPINGASGHVALVGEDDRDTTIAQFVEYGEGRHRADFDLVTPGRHRFTGIVEKDGKLLKEASGQIAVESFSIEEYQRRPDFGTLAAVSQLTGGSFVPIGSADSVYSIINQEIIIVSTQKEIVLWNKFWLLTLFITALAIEWFLRKRYQLI